MANTKLRKAKQTKNDEFYTQYIDIQKEVNSYLEYNPNVFRGKTILLPCDDPEWSNFTKFFAQNFDRFGLKKLISTSYSYESKKIFEPYQLSLLEKDSPKYDETKTKSHGKMFVLQKDSNNSGKIDINDLEWEYLDGDGDFRSEEVCKLRDEADIIITNPPFSLYREFVEWLFSKNKFFLMIANKNSITYKEIFPLLRDNKMWSGVTSWSGGLWFETIDKNDYDKLENGKHLKNVSSVWFTNLEHGRRHQPLQLMTMEDNIKFSKHKEIKGKEYSKYENFDAIDIPYTDAIPKDYNGYMGVPVTFLEKYNPEQFNIVGLGISNSGLEIGVKAYKEEHKQYRKNIEHKGAVDGDLYMLDSNGHPVVPYARIIIEWKRIRRNSDG